MCLSFTKIARNRSISTAAAQRIFVPFQRTGGVGQSKISRRPDDRQLSERNELYTIGPTDTYPTSSTGLPRSAKSWSFIPYSESKFL